MEPLEDTRIAWSPFPGTQTRFIACTADEVLFGGSAGGAKSESMLMAPTRFFRERQFRALLLRRTFPELELSLIDRSRQLYPLLGATYNESKHIWNMSSGARLFFGYAESMADVYQYQSSAFSFIGIDEASQIPFEVFRYLLSRARSAHGLPVQIRLATNPGGQHADWIFERWAPWLDPESPVKAKPGQWLWFLNAEDGERYVPRGTPGAQSRTFIPSRLEDNPYLRDSGYRERLMGLDPVTRAQLLEGNWTIRPSAGAYFKREMFEIVDAPPAQAKRIRYWDRAATEAGAGRDPDWTAGVRMALAPDRTLYVEDVVRVRAAPKDVAALIRQTAEMDGHEVKIGFEVDPGQAGKFEADYYARNVLQGFNVEMAKPTGDKVTRAGPASAQAVARNIKLVRAYWNPKYLEELEGFPDGAHDDQVDATSGALSLLVFRSPGNEYSGLAGFQGRVWRDVGHVSGSLDGGPRLARWASPRDSGGRGFSTPYGPTKGR